MNGLDTAREIRKIIPIDTPILFLTSYDWSEIETEALEIDVDGFLAKPFTTINLKEKLIEVENFKNAVSGPEVALELKGLHSAGGRASGRTAASGAARACSGAGKKSGPRGVPGAAGYELCGTYRKSDRIQL